MSKRAFNILLGDSTELVEEIKHQPGYKCMMGADRKDNWSLYRTDLGLYWDVDEEVENLTHQFMILPKDPVIYIFFNYRQKNPIEHTQRIYKMAAQDLAAQSEKKFCIIGINFQSRHKFQKEIKKKIIEWCIAEEATHGKNYCFYSDFEDLPGDW